jgi:hypothetical protein
MNWHPQTDQYASECCDMTERERVIGLLQAYAVRQKEGQLAVLLHNAAALLQEQDREIESLRGDLFDRHRELLRAQA